MENLQNQWDVSKAKREALQYLASGERVHYSSRRINNGLEDFDESAKAGFAILKEHGAAMLADFSAEERERFENQTSAKE